MSLDRRQTDGGMARCESRKQPLLLRLWRIGVSVEVEGTTFETIPETLFSELH
jgi:hypothetical protein